MEGNHVRGDWAILHMYILQVFTESAQWVDICLRVAISVCVCVVPSLITHFQVSWRPLVKDGIPNIGIG